MTATRYKTKPSLARDCILPNCKPHWIIIVQMFYKFKRYF